MSGRLPPPGAPERGALAPPAHPRSAVLAGSAADPDPQVRLEGSGAREQAAADLCG